ncbi:MAG: hypothetical protein HeimC2_02320 [Candidatus Heimdallarchaeota archaeon LC_2]|nr:MAG: hypothetical protein HeimC2_02320 [Candidatus Heimdallarchaeota archaeon LC_2]
MKVESVDPNDQLLLDLHIKVLQKILLQEPFDQIKIHYQQNMNDLNYIEIIKNSGHLSFDDGNKLIGAYPISPSPTDYSVNLEGIGEGFSMCAVDALGIPYTFMRKTIIKTIDKSTGNDLELIIDPHSENQEILDIFVAYQNTPEDLQGSNSAAKVQCPTINFYSSKSDIPSNLQTWTYLQALEYAKKRFSRAEMLARIKKIIN